MGLLDVLTGMRNGPRGGSSGGGGMSPITMALLGLLAYKAVKGFSAAKPAGPGAMVPTDGGPGAGAGAGRGLSDILKDSFGNAGQGGLGSILSGGLGDLLKQFQGAGQADVADSWIGRSENKPIGPGDLSRVLTPEQIEFLSQRTGLTREQLLAGLAAQLPTTIDELTPQGRLPSPDELDRPVTKTS